MAGAFPVAVEVACRIGGILGSPSRRLVELLLFLVDHGEFDGDGVLVGLRPKPRLGLDYRVCACGVCSVEARRILDAIPGICGGLPRPLDSGLEEVIGYTLKYAGIPEGDLEHLLTRVLGVEDGAARILVLHASVQSLLEAREEARRLAEQGLIVDI